jgi:hypothetical protein
MKGRNIPFAASSDASIWNVVNPSFVSTVTRVDHPTLLTKTGSLTGV